MVVVVVVVEVSVVVVVLRWVGLGYINWLYLFIG